MTDEDLRRLRDDHEALRHGIDHPFWAILDRELAKREQNALDAILRATDTMSVGRAVGEFQATRSLRQLPAMLRNSLQAIIENSVAAKHHI